MGFGVVARGAGIGSGQGMGAGAGARKDRLAGKIRLNADVRVRGLFTGVLSARTRSR